MTIRIALLITFLALGIFSIPAQACSPVPSSPDNDNALIEKAAAIATIKVTQSEADQPEAANKRVIAMQAEILNVYKGDLSAGQNTTLYTHNYGTCSLFLHSGITRDVLLFKEGDDYYLGSSTDSISYEAWEKLKQ